jgi:mRNA interferase MazF
MPNYSKSDVVMVRYPFSDLGASKVRPAVIVSAPHASQDVFVVPLTSRSAGLLSGEFLLAHWAEAGLNVPTAVKRGLYPIHHSLIVKAVGRLSESDAQKVQMSLREWSEL